jgi:hypothetical protein
VHREVTMKIVAAVLLALMLSACNPELIDYPSARFDPLNEDRAAVRPCSPDVSFLSMRAMPRGDRANAHECESLVSGWCCSVIK